MHITFQRNARVQGRRGDSIGSLLFCISLHNSTQRFGYTAEQGLIPSYNFIREQRRGVILKAHSLAQISKKPTVIQKSTSVCLTVLSLTDISQQKILYGCKIAIQKTNKSDINCGKKWGIHIPLGIYCCSRGLWSFMISSLFFFIFPVVFYVKRSIYKTSK